VIGEIEINKYPSKMEAIIICAMSTNVSFLVVATQHHAIITSGKKVKM